MLFWYKFGIVSIKGNDVIQKIGSHEIANMLRQDILNGVLNSKQRLPSERILAEQYKVARGTIREALNILAIEKLVEIRPGSGTYIIGENPEQRFPMIDGASPLELVDARFALEPHVCRLAILNARQQELDAIERILVEMNNLTEDPIAFSRGDTQFHTLLAETTKNRLLIWIVGQTNSVRNQHQRHRMRNLTLDKPTMELYNEQHRRILNAIRDREPELAAQAMKDHLEAARLSLTRAAAT